MYDRTEVGSRGYLTEEFRLFHLRDQQQLQLQVQQQLQQMDQHQILPSLHLLIL